MNEAVGIGETKPESRSRFMGNAAADSKQGFMMHPKEPSN